MHTRFYMQLVTATGDLISYQRVDDVEFDLRAKRYAAMFDFARCMVRIRSLRTCRLTPPAGLEAARVHQRHRQSRHWLRR